MTRQSPVSFSAYAFIWLITVGLLISGCSPVKKPVTQTVPPPAATQSPELQPSSPSPTTPATLPAATLAPSLSPTPAVLQPVSFKPLSREELSQPETYHHAFLFIASNYFLSTRDGFDDPQMPKTEGAELWLFKPDQQQAGRISPQGFSTAIYTPVNGPVKMISYETPAEKALIQAMGWQEVLAPELCRLPADGSKPAPDFVPCTNLRFSADGRLLVYQIPLASCSSQVRILNLDKRMHAVSEKTGGHWVLPLPSGPILYAKGHCEGGQVIRFNPDTGKSDILEAEGPFYWNPQQTAFISEVGDEIGNSVSFWGYNSEANLKFINIRPFENNEYDQNPTWTPDGKAVLFEHMAYSRDLKLNTYQFNRPLEVVKVGIGARTQTKIASDPKFNYRIGSWSGDFLVIKRYPFKNTTTLPAEVVTTSDDEKAVEAKCIDYGYEEDCGPMELFGYNDKTGNLVPWAETGQPLPERAPEVEPTLDASSPAFYEDKNGAYRLVRGPANPVPVSGPGNWIDRSAGSLWIVPKGGEPKPWIDNGWSYTLIP